MKRNYVSTIDFKAMLKEKLRDLPRHKNPLVRGPKDKTPGYPKLKHSKAIKSRPPHLRGHAH